jgi:hypothetical protein
MELPPLKETNCEFGHSHPLHFVLKLPGLGPIGAARYPQAVTDWNRLASIGFRWVICACSEDPGYDPSPLNFLTKIELTDLSGASQPDHPRTEFNQILFSARTALTKLKEEGVLIHCEGGRGRTGTIIGVILRLFGYEPTEITAFLKNAYLIAGRSGWPEKPWQSEVISRVQPREEETRNSLT